MPFSELTTGSDSYVAVAPLPDDPSYTIRGLAGNDTISGHNGSDALYGNQQNDVLAGREGNDSLYGGHGDDALFGQQGNDVLIGNDGNDAIYGGQGNDLIYASAPWTGLIYTGHDHIMGGVGDDTIHGTQGLAGTDGTYYGNEGNDRMEVFVTAGYFLLAGGKGDDVFLTGLPGSQAGFDIFGGVGNDYAIGAGGINYFAGGIGNDTLSGAHGAFTLEGDDGNDALGLGAQASGVAHGGIGDDILISQEMGNVLDGGEGNDVMLGGGGADVFFFGPRFTGAGGSVVSYTDRIDDFTAGEDIIHLHGLGLSFETLAITDTAGGASIAYTDNAQLLGTILLPGLTAASLDTADFLFT